VKKIALVLGGSSDIGKEVVLRFLSAGWDVISHCNKNLNHLKKIKNNYPNNLILIKSDFSKKNSLSEIIKKLNKYKISSFINLVGFIDNISYDKTNLENLNKCFQINAFIPMLIQKSIIKKMIKGKYGRILNVSSIGVKYGGGKNTFNYSFSKHALEFIPSKIKSLTNLNILSNILRVGVVNTKMMKKIKNKNIAKRISLIPIKRAAKRTEIAETIYFLSSDKNTYISNEKITIAGGE